jgi:hypothetical protein
MNGFGEIHEEGIRCRLVPSLGSGWLFSAFAACVGRRAFRRALGISCLDASLIDTLLAPELASDLRSILVFLMFLG